MATTSSVTQQDAQFDSFLYAPVEAEIFGSISVLSALARSNVDPWTEAAELARLPTPVATSRLAAVIAVLPQISAGPLDAEIVSARLIALLPRFGGFSIPAPKSLRVPAFTLPIITRFLVGVLISLIIIVIGMRYMTG